MHQRRVGEDLANRGCPHADSRDRSARVAQTAGVISPPYSWRNDAGYRRSSQRYARIHTFPGARPRARAMPTRSAIRFASALAAAVPSGVMR